MSFLSVGDIAPRFALPADTGGAFDLYGDNVAGNFIAIIFCPGGISRATDQLQSFTECYETLREKGVVIVAVSDESLTELAVQRQRLELPFDLLSDHSRELFSGYGIANGKNQADSKPVTVLIRPNLHCLGIMRKGNLAEKTLGAVCEHRERQNELALGFQPPILMVPDVLNGDDCQRLIERYNSPDTPIVKSSDVDILNMERDVKVQVPDYDRRDRIDHMITSDEFKTFVSERLRSRLLPEIRKAFHYRATAFEALRIACYEGARGGQAHGHRDNSVPEVAHRRFALSINLNTEDFEGGEIRFPEYGPRHYRAQTGAALIFSCSLLHEALTVTRGRRLVLLAFLTGE